MFGEQALIYKKRRGAHIIVTSENAEFCIMNEKDYDVIFGEMQRHEEELRKLFFEEKALNEPEMKPLARVIAVNFTKKLVPRGRELFRQGDRPDKLYFIYKGQVTLWEELSSQKTEDHELFPSVPKKPRTESLRADWSKKTKRRDLVVLSTGKMLGEGELFTGERRKYTATSDCELVVYEIENERMINLCSDNVSLRMIMDQKIEEKYMLIQHLRLFKNKNEIYKEIILKKMDREAKVQPSTKPQSITITRAHINESNKNNNSPLFVTSAHTDQKITKDRFFINRNVLNSKSLKMMRSNPIKDKDTEYATSVQAKEEAEEQKSLRHSSLDLMSKVDRLWGINKDYSKLTLSKETKLLDLGVMPRRRMPCEVSSQVRKN